MTTVNLCSTESILNVSGEMRAASLEHVVSMAGEIRYELKRIFVETFESDVILVGTL